MIEHIIEDLIQNPSEENKSKLEKELNTLEYDTLKEAESFPKKSREYFEKRTEAFSIRSKYAKMILAKWVSKFGSTQGCPVTYEMTLNIPFRQIKKP